MAKVLAEFAEHIASDEGGSCIEPKPPVHRCPMADGRDGSNSFPLLAERRCERRERQHSRIIVTRFTGRLGLRVCTWKALSAVP